MLLIILINRKLLYSILAIGTLFIVFFTIALFKNEKANKQEESRVVNEEENKEDDKKDPDDQKEKEDDKKQNESENIIWGVDSSTKVDEDFYQCVNEHFGKPDVWGRYLGDKEGVSSGLEKQEIELLHKKDINILLIYNHVNTATGKDKGKETAEHAISLAKEINVLEGIGIFVDIEPSYPIDSLFIQTWYETIKDSSYKPGIYGVFDEDSKIVEALNDTGSEVKDNLIIWNAYPQEKITTKDQAPEFEQKGIKDVYQLGWQYGQDAKECNIDTNLFKESIKDHTWEKD